MTEPSEKKPNIVTTRTPKKKTQGIFDNLRTLPQPHPVEEILGLTETTTSTPSSDSTGSTASTASTPSTPSRRTPKSAIAPERDFTRVANSIVRTAVPSGLFGEQGGKSKELYDTLYALTRGAVVPRRTIRLPKDQLMRKAGIGSEVTLRKNLARLRDARLIRESIVPGTHGGNEYEIFLPEEVGLITGSTPSTPSSVTTASSSRQMREAVEAVDATGSSPGSTQSESTVSGKNKTSSLKPLGTIDDEATPLATALKQLVAEITGRQATSNELAQFTEVIEVIAIEAKIAAARTTVSSVAPFLAEHLRRRLFKKDKQQLAVETAQSEPLQAAVDASECPDCGGAGWYYPESKEKGIAKCRHLSLK